MKSLNTWDTEISDKFIHTDDIEELLNYLKDRRKIFYIRFKEKFTPGDSINYSFEGDFVNNNIRATYVCNEKPVCFSLEDPTFVTVKREFYDQHEDKIKAVLKENLFNEQFRITITPLMFSPELVDALIDKNLNTSCIFEFEDVVVPQRIINKLNNNCIFAIQIINGEVKEISSNHIVGNISKNTISFGHFCLVLNKDDIIDSGRLKYIPDDSVISVDTSLDGEMGYKKIEELILKFEEIGKSIIIKIPIKSRVEFKKSNLLNLDLNYVKFYVNTDCYDYPIEQYAEEERRLDEMVRPINDANLSPLEKYIAVYNIVKNFKEYRENSKDKKQSRYLRFILNNEYMTCVGYSVLLKTLCEKIGISCEQFYVDVDMSYATGFTVEEETVTREGHARNLVSIDDDKYGIHGIYMADSTWDNDLNKDDMFFALAPIEKANQGDHMFWNNETFLILDVHSFKEFSDRVNYIMKKRYLEGLKDVNGDLDYNFKNYNTEKLSKSEYEAQMKEGQLKLAYMEADDYIKKALSVESEVYESIRSKYSNEFSDYDNFFTEIGHYIIKRTNNSFDSTIILDAHIASLKELGIFEEYEIDVEKLKIDFIKNSTLKYPYIVSKDNVHRLIRFSDPKYLLEEKEKTK